MGCELAERAFEGAQRFDIVLAAVVVFEAADFRLQRLVGDAQFVDQAFDMVGDRDGRLVGRLQPGGEAVDHIVDIVDREGGARFRRLDPAGQAVERGGRILYRRHRHRRRAGAAGIRVGRLTRLGLLDHRQQAVEILAQRDAFRQGRFACCVAGPLVGAELAPSGLAHLPLPTPVPLPHG